MRPRRHFFVLAHGRSGTAFLAELLDRAPNARVLHEPGPADPQLLGLSRYGRSDRAVEALLEDRFTALLPDDPGIEVYGEVNSFLRYCAHWLRRRLDAHLLHVSRDGRDVVRSIYERDALTSNQAQLPIVPTDDDPWADAWPEFSRFERICWIWQHTNEMLWRSVGHHVRLEDLISSYDRFRAALLEPLGLEIPETTWRAEAEQPRNTGARYRARRLLRSALRGRQAAGEERLPHWSRWSEEQSERFWRICGETMELLGYGSGAVDSGTASSSTETGVGHS